MYNGICIEYAMYKIDETSIILFFSFKIAYKYEIEPHAIDWELSSSCQCRLTETSELGLDNRQMRFYPPMKDRVRGS